MDVIKELLEGIPLPKMVKVKMAFSAKKVADVEAAVRQELAKPGICDSIKPGMHIAVGVGSRGLANLPTLV